MSTAIDNESRLSQPKGVVGGISIFGNAGPQLIASMKEKSSSLTKIGGNTQNGNTANSTNEGPPKKRSFGKGTAAPSHPKPKAPSLPLNNSKPTEHNRNSRNLSSGGKLGIAYCREHIEHNVIY